MDTERPIANPSVVFQKGFDGWAVVVNMGTGASVSLNPTGIAVWQLINGRRTVDQIVRAFTSQFQGVPDTVDEDIGSLLATLKEEGLVGYEING
ncbi:PqqD family peptide modification chaperone [bacterium]|nr:PqqD family peptide modification chaperone [bacterium]